MSRRDDVPPRPRRRPRRWPRRRSTSTSRRVVDHAGGPLLVLAGPGTGKTTTLVEAIVDRIERRGADPTQVLALTFSPQGRRAAARPGHRAARPHDVDHACARRSTPSPTAWSARYAPGRPLRRAAAAALAPPSRTSCSSELLTDAPESVRWPDGAAAGALGTRGFAARGAGGARAGPREGPRPRRPARARREREALPEFVAAGALPRAVPRSPRLPERHRLRRPDRAAPAARGRRAPRRAARAGSRTSSSTSTRTPTPARSRCCGRWPATAAT